MQEEIEFWVVLNAPVRVLLTEEEGGVQIFKKQSLIGAWESRWGRRESLWPAGPFLAPMGLGQLDLKSDAVPGVT